MCGKCGTGFLDYDEQAGVYFESCECGEVVSGGMDDEMLALFLATHTVEEVKV